VTASPAWHNLFFYGDDGALVDQIVPFITEGLAEHEAVLIVLDPRKTALVREALGRIGRRVLSLDRDAFYARPEDALAGYDARVRRFVADGASHVRVFGEVPLCRTTEESDAWIRYEALLNPAFAHHPVTIVCGLDGREQPDSMVEGSWRTHPGSLERDGSDNEHFHDPAETVRALTPPPADVSGLEAVPVDDGARALRLRLQESMTAAGVADDRAQRMLAAAGEILANAHQHGGGVRGLRAGRVGERFVCEISDHGPGLDDPVAGFVPPYSQQGGAAGLWVARQATTRLEMISTERGLTTRLWV
jgi:anti-sigma regulatory factor (Ser/Thr protein kinase)